MNINHLECMAEIARTGSISGAAQKLMVSQPYLSMLVKGVERELGFQIFTRTGTGIILTKQGKKCMRSVEKILAEMNVIRHICEEQDQSLAVAMFYSPFFMKVFLEFKRQRENNPSDRIFEMGFLECLESVRKGHSRLGLACYEAGRRDVYWGLARENDCRFMKLIEPRPMQAMISRDHELADLEEISLEQLTRLPLVTYDDEGSVAFMKNLCVGEAEHIFLVSDRGSFYDAVRNGGYVSVTARVCNDITMEDGLKYIPLTGTGMRLEFVYVVAEDYKLTKREVEFIKFIRQKAEPI